MRILHFADVHLDRPFVGLAPDAARQRRIDLMDAFDRCLDGAHKHEVDAITIGGDLWEDENVTPDTRGSVAHALALLEVPVVIVAGNHDPHLRGGTYQRTGWPDNVTVVDRSTPVEVPISSDVSLWAASWTERPLSCDFLKSFRVPDDERAHVLLLHGTARDARFQMTTTHCPFDPSDVAQAGFPIMLCGHIHAASCTNNVVYPGSPEPLDHSEVGRHCYAIADVDPDAVHVELIDVNRRRYITVRVDCSDASSSAEVETRVREAIEVASDHDAVANVELWGETAPDCAIDRAVLTTHLERDFAAASVADRTDARVDNSAIARRHSADGLFVADLLERIARSSDDRERRVLEMALRAGVRAMRGEKDVLRVG